MNHLSSASSNYTLLQVSIAWENNGNGTKTATVAETQEFSIDPII
jgi:hypothetical protein